MGNQVAAMTQLFTPLVNSSVGQATPVATATPNATGPAVDAVEVIEIDPPERFVKKVDYLSLLQHLSRLGTKQFSGSTDPVVADEWRSRLVRNFQSTRCPEDYRRDIAVHFLEGEAHNWWLAVDKRTNGSLTIFADFEVELTANTFLLRLGIVWKLSF